MNKQVGDKLLFLEDLPKNRIYIIIDESLSVKIKSKIKENFGSTNKFIQKGMAPSSIYRWIKKREFPLGELIKVLKSLNIFATNLSSSLSHLRTGHYPSRKNNGGNLGTPIPNPLPLKLTLELTRIISHLFADGCITLDKNGYLTAAYYNQSKVLINQFKEDIEKVFGLDDIKVKKNKTTEYVYLPSTISIILLKLCPTFKSKNCRIPPFIKKSDNNLKREFLKAFFDDESFVKFVPPYRHIELSINNLELLREIKKLLEGVGIKSTEILERKIRGFDVQSIYIRGAENLFNFKEQVGFSEPSKKKKLDLILKNPGRNSYGKGETNRKVLSLLSKPKTITEVSKSIKRDYSTANLVIKKLANQGKITCKKLKGVNYWQQHDN
tara:strand:+ start:2058 stop:3203 length:1146 start_codon:yes stop_codon:yes gene_type:complete